MDFGLVDKLSAALKNPDYCLTGNAAVVALLREHNKSFEILFVKRVETPRDPWSGQTAFPGGKCCPEDNNLKDTVIRETFEETKINLGKNCKFLGTMKPIKSIQRPQMLILPFVVLQLEKQKIELNHELANFFWVPLTELTKTNSTTYYMSKNYPAYILKNNVVWGITYQITKSLVSLLLQFLE